MADSRGTEGIDIDTEIHGVDREIAQAMAKIEAAERTAQFDIPMEVHDRNFAEIMGRMGMSTTHGFQFQDDLLADIQGADLDFGGFNVRRGRGIGGRDGPAFPRLRRSVRRVSGAFSELQDRLNNFDIRMSDLHNLLAALVPLLVVFIGTIPALVTAFVGLAAAALTATAALGAIAGFGALGVGLEDGQFDMQNLTDVWNQIRDDFIDAFAPLAEQLEPLFRDAIDGLGRFFQAVANQGDALMELTDEARAFGQFIMNFVPGALRTLSSLVEALAPQLSNVGEAIDDNFNYFMRELTRLTAAALPAVSAFIQTIIAALPTLVEMGIQFTHIATAVLRVIGVFWEILTLGGALDGMMGTLIATILVAASAVALLTRSMVILAGRAIASATVALFNFLRGLILTSNAIGYLSITNIGRAISSIYSFISSINIGSASLIGFSLSARQAAIAAAAFWTAVTLGAAAVLIPMIVSMTSGFLGLSDGIDQATSSLKEFDRVSGQTEGGFNPYDGDDPPSSGAGAATGGANQTVINVESSGDPQDDRSNARYVSFRQGRTTGGNN